MAKRGDFVQIQVKILEPGERAPNLPEDTKRVPFEMRVKGFLIEEEAKLGSSVKIRTFSGREISGTLVAINPVYEHNFGEPVPELLNIGEELRKILGGE
ncbi:MAG: 2-amino-4-oxopentanoate thiolase subunit OrtA [Synergistetes bacterium]|nr:2-amino-4-oxopentanoate thiolase subunit OrtA [Synergistota bacterium]MCX8127522.1 2-amino-4-oxopentanoate thiolase subunit OrtA [Synergistota bacterium]